MFSSGIWMFSSLSLFLYFLPQRWFSFSLSVYIFLKRIFMSSLRFTAKLNGRYRVSSYSPCSHTHTAYSVISISQLSGTFGTTDETTLTHHNHSESAAYVNSWFCTLFGFGYMSKGIYPLYSIIQSTFTSLKINWAPPIHPFHPLSVFKINNCWMSATSRNGLVP